MSAVMGIPLSRGQDAQAQEIEACTSVHGPFDQFEAVYVSFDWAAAPFMFESCLNGRFIPAKVSGE